LPSDHGRDDERWPCFLEHRLAIAWMRDGAPERAFVYAQSLEFRYAAQPAEFSAEARGPFKNAGSPAEA